MHELNRSPTMPDLKLSDAADLATAAPGRSCPLHYRYSPGVFHRPADAGCEALDVLYVVGGLYGHAGALAQIQGLFAAETGRKRLVFNGDFNWFNVDASAYEALNTAVLGFDALRGNVETELAGPDAAADAGCGCAYPDWVGDGVVERSNRILQRLRRTAQQFPALQAQLAALPMHRRADVCGLRVAIVHGDAESLAGWGFAQEHLQQPPHRARVRQWFDAAQVDAFACSHTCLPVFHSLPMAGRAITPVVLNNGAAGMPNFRGDAAGLFTRIATTAYVGPGRRYGITREVAGRVIHLDGVAVAGDSNSARAAQSAFLRQWPECSDAHASYWARIQNGPDYTPEEALRTSLD
jgi:hypothetical protein